VHFAIPRYILTIDFQVSGIFMTKILAVISTLIVLAGGGGYYYLEIFLPEQERIAAAEAEAAEAARIAQQLIDSANACSEIARTSRGQSGSSKRMEILKSYGWQPHEADKFEPYLQIISAANDAPSIGGTTIRTKSQVCILEKLFTCSEAYIALREDNEAYLKEQLDTTLAACTET
jgi:hypothetical protein